MRDRQWQFDRAGLIGLALFVSISVILTVIGVPRSVTWLLGALFLAWILVRRLGPSLIRRKLYRNRCADGDLEFHAELFDVRASVLGTLADHDITWLSDFGGVDLRHDTYGFEVTGIRTEPLAYRIERLLLREFPWWWWHRTYYEDLNVGELGWKVVFSRFPDWCGEGEWRSNEQ